MKSTPQAPDRRSADPQPDALEQLLAQGPGRILAGPPDGLRDRVLADIRSPHRGKDSGTLRFAAPHWVGAALAAGLLLGFGLANLRPTPPPTEPTTLELVERLTTRFVALVESQETTAIDLRTAVDDPLLAEVDAILLDTTLVAQATWNGLPGRLHKLFDESATEIR